MTVTKYTLRASSAWELHGLLCAAGEGKTRRYAWAEDGVLYFDEARVRLPYPEMQAAEPDPETGAPIYAPTGYWRCEVSLVDESDGELWVMAI